MRSISARVHRTSPYATFITSMRLLSDVDWPEFFESVSLVDELLRSNSGFASMDFASRDLYRAAIEPIGARLEAHRARHCARSSIGGRWGDRERGACRGHWGSAT